MKRMAGLLLALGLSTCGAQEPVYAQCGPYYGPCGPPPGPGGYPGLYREYGGRGYGPFTPPRPRGPDYYQEFRNYGGRDQGYGPPPPRFIPGPGQRPQW